MALKIINYKIYSFRKINAISKNSSGIGVKEFLLDFSFYMNDFTISESRKSGGDILHLFRTLKYRASHKGTMTGLLGKNGPNSPLMKYNSSA